MSDDDCLHCEIWRTIKLFNETHESLDFDDVMEALADVIGDNIWIAKSLGEHMRSVTIKRIDKRVAWRKKHGGIERDST